MTTALIVRYVRAEGGDDAVAEMLRIAGENRTAAELEDESTWSSYGQKIALFEAAAHVMGEPFAAVALDVAVALREAREGQEVAHKLLDLAGDLAQAVDKEEIGRLLAEAVPVIVGVPRAAVLVWDEASDTLVGCASHGYPPDTADFLLHLAIRPEDTPELKEMLLSPEPRFYRYDATAEDPFVRGMMDVFDTEAVLIVPILVRGSFHGVVGADYGAGADPSPADVDDATIARLVGLADQGSIAFERMRLMDQERATTERLREANQFKSEFLGVVSHELRTPLAAILGMARTLTARASLLDESTRSEFLTAIIQRGEQLERMVHDLLRSSRGIELDRKQVDLGPLLRRTVDDARQLSPGVSIECSVTGELSCLVDAEKLRQVLENLITNAFKYAPGAPVVIDARRRGDSIWLMVEDWGPGMERQELARAFDAFYQGAPSEGGKGVGLGLYISRRIVEAHGGTISIDSQPGRGTRIRVTLPASSSSVAST